MKRLSECIRNTVHQFRCRGGFIFVKGGVYNQMNVTVEPAHTSSKGIQPFNRQII